jgi:hypothetical protein
MRRVVMNKDYMKYYSVVVESIQTRITSLKKIKTGKALINEFLLGRLTYYEIDKEILGILGWNIILPFTWGDFNIFREAEIVNFDGRKIKCSVSNAIKILEQMETEFRNQFQRCKPSIKLDFVLFTKKRHAIYKKEISPTPNKKEETKSTVQIGILPPKFYEDIKKINDEIKSWSSTNTKSCKTKIIRLILSYYKEEWKYYKLFDDRRYFAGKVYPLIKHDLDWDIERFLYTVNKNFYYTPSS